MGKNNQTKRHTGRLQAVTLCISTAMVLVLLGLIVFITLVGRNLSANVKENLIVTVEFEQEMTDNEALSLCKGMAKKPYIKDIHFVSKEEALKEQRQALGSDPTEFTGGVNPFQASVDLTLQSDYANPDSLQWISKELKAYPKVFQVNYQKDLVKVVNQNLARIELIMLVLAILLTFISFALINNTVRLSIYARRFSIHIMKLVGASWSFIRWPFVRQAIGLGLLAALLACLFLGGCVYALYYYQPEVETVLTWRDMVITGVAVFLFGVIITGFCASVSVNKFLKMKASELYKI